MIDVSASPQKPTTNLPAIVLAGLLAFVIWQSGYWEKFTPDKERDQPAGKVAGVLVIKSQDMTVDQAQVANSAVIDEICDQRNIPFRALWADAGDLSNADEWVRQLLSFYSDEAPCLATIDANGNRTRYELPASISEFRRLVGAN
ncbi:MAG: hypothetical protein GY878_05945 [Fuerstiella sp.]|nr:hypothetical protein [Fuerstiella sp.]